MKITSINALEILDSRGKPTVRAFVTLDDGSVHSSSVPSGASTGSHEAHELRDGDTARHLGQGVLKAVDHVRKDIASVLVGMDVSEPREIDKKMLELDGTENKTNLGANAILAVSQAVVRAAAHQAKVPLWKYINQYYFSDRTPAFPRLMVNVVNGGKHANWNFDLQEFMFVPVPTAPSQSVRMAAETFQHLGKNLKAEGLATLVGDEGGYSPALQSDHEVLEHILKGAVDAGYENKKDFNFAIDAASSEFYHDGAYQLKKLNKTMTAAELMEYYTELGIKYGILSYEDPFSEDDWQAFTDFTAKCTPHQCIVIGDDLFVTNPKRIQKGIEMHAATGVLIKVNQIGSVYETTEAIKMTQGAGWKVAISHRSGETEDNFIADLAYGCASDFIKTGSMSRSDRLSKYNRLLEIEAGL